MTVLEIPIALDSPVRLCGIPLLRFVLATIIATVGHLAVSGLLFGGAFSCGMAAAGFNGSQYIGPSNAFLSAFHVWNAGYVYGWAPNRERVLPAFPPYQEFPKIGSDEQASIAYQPYFRETGRIGKMRRTIETMVFICWAIVCGITGALLYIFRRTRSCIPNTPHDA